MADDPPSAFKDWEHALDALSAGVKLLATGDLRLPEDAAILDRLEGAETRTRRAARRASKASAALRTKAVPMRPSSATVKAEVLPQMATLGKLCEKTCANLPKDQAEELTRKAGEAERLVRQVESQRNAMRERGIGREAPPGARHAVRVLQQFEAFALTAVGGAAGNELSGVINNLIHAIQAKPH